MLQKQTAGSTIGYLILLSLFLGIIGVIRPVIEINKGVDEIYHAFQKESREFIFSNGELKIEGQMPIVYNATNGDSEIFIIDTSGKTSREDLAKYDKATLITSNYMIQKKNSMQITETNFNALRSFTISKADVEKFIPYLKYISIILVIFGPITFFIGKLFTALIVSLLGMIIKSIQKVNITFGTIYKLSIYALTLPIMVNVSLKLTNLEIPHFYKLYCLGAAAYLWFGLKAIKDEEGNQVFSQ